MADTTINLGPARVVDQLYIDNGDGTYSLGVALSSGASLSKGTTISQTPTVTAGAYSAGDAQRSG